MPQYVVLNNPPVINIPRGKTIWLCSDCIAAKYSNDPQPLAKAVCKCEGCEQNKQCSEVEKKRLVPIPPKKRVKKESVRVQFNIFSRQVVVK